MARVIELEGGGVLTLHERWIEEPEATALFAALRDGVGWRQDKVKFYGKEHLQPRLTAWFGDPEAHYTYSGLSLAPEPWTPLLASLRDRAGAEASQSFNSVLLNYYRDGDDSMGLHADAEKELGRDPVIASLSFGEARRFVMKYVGKRKDVSPVELSLPGGSLLVMGGTTQHFWRHGVPKEKGRGGRINLTFRRIVPRV